MPIGKNSISRVKKNGYSNISSEAPDMEDSVIKEPEKPTPVSKKRQSKSPKKKNIVSVGDKMPIYLL